MGRVGTVEPPHIVLPLTVEPTKPRLCHDARYLNLWMLDKSFTLDHLRDLPRYVTQDSFQTVLDDKSGYDHILLNQDSRTFFGIQWGGWYFTYNTLPFGWKLSPCIYHTTGLMATNFFRSIGIPCLLYIDNRHNGQLQVPLDKGQYRLIQTEEDRRFAAANSAIFLVAYYLVKLGYFLGLKKSILKPEKSVPYLGFIANSSTQSFHLIPGKKIKFLNLLREILQSSYISVKTLQRLVGKCVSFSLAVPAAKLFTREMNAAISTGLRTQKRLPMHGALKEEISYWLFLETWDEPLKWREERHVQVKVATDASASGWGATITSPVQKQMSDYWTREEESWDIATKEAMALNKLLLSSADLLRNARVDASVDNQAVIHAWSNQGGRSASLNRVIKELFYTTMRLGVLLHLSYIPTTENPADAPSRRLSTLDSCLSQRLWQKVQTEFGGAEGHSCDLMSLDSNVMKDTNGNDLPHFTPFPSPGSSGVNIFAQDLTQHGLMMRHPYVFPPLVLVGPLLRFLELHQQAFTIVILDIYPRKYWWPLLHSRAIKVLKLASKGDQGALLLPTRKGWVPQRCIPGDLWAFAVSPTGH